MALNGYRPDYPEHNDRHWHGDNRRNNPYYSRDIRNMGYVRSSRDNRGADPEFEPRRFRDYDRNYNEEYGRDFNYQFEPSDRWYRQGHHKWDEVDYRDRNNNYYQGTSARGAEYQDRGRGGSDERQGSSRYNNDWESGRYRGYRNEIDRQEGRPRNDDRYSSRWMDEDRYQQGRYRFEGGRPRSEQDDNRSYRDRDQQGRGRWW